MKMLWIPGLLLVMATLSLLYILQRKRQQFLQWIRDGELAIESAPALAHAPNEALPPLLKAYLRKTLGASVQVIHHVRLKQSGFMALHAGPADKRFIAEQIIAIGEPGFSWSAEVSMLPLIRVKVCDRLVGADGQLEARVAGAVAVAKQSGEGLLKGELLRYLAELPWAPWGFLRLREASWVEKSPRELELSWAYAGVPVRITYVFDEKNLITGIRVEDRPRLLDDGAVVPTVWVGEFANYTDYQGILIPRIAAVSWITGGGAEKFTYFKGQIEDYQIIP